jgi:hypothetical protein
VPFDVAFCANKGVLRHKNEASRIGRRVKFAIKKPLGVKCVRIDDIAKLILLRFDSARGAKVFYAALASV